MCCAKQFPAGATRSDGVRTKGARTTGFKTPAIPATARDRKAVSGRLA